MFSLAAALLFQAADAPSETITLAEAKIRPAHRIASLVLPPELAGRTIGGMIRRAFVPGHVYRAAFWEQPVPHGTMVCRRRMHATRLQNPRAPERPDDASKVLLEIGRTDSRDQFGLSYPEPASAASCAEVKGFATPTSSNGEATIRALAQLSDAMRLASGKGPLPFRLQCEAAEEDDVCADARSALAGLPLNALFGVAFDTGHTVREAVVKEGKTIGYIRRTAPAPDGSPPTPTVEFGRSGRDGKSWRITLSGTPERLEEVQMRRSSIIYH